MYPVLYDSALIDRTLGKGKLTEATRCVVYEKLNGDWWLEIDYPITGAAYSELARGGTIGVVSPHCDDITDTLRNWTTLEYFDIVKYSKAIDGIVTFTAQHISRRLAQGVCILNQVNTSGHTNWQQVFTEAIPNTYNGVTFAGKDSPHDVSIGDISIPTPKTPLAVLVGDNGSFITDGGVDIAFSSSYVVGLGAVVYVIAVAHRGEDRGAEIRFGVNMLDIEHVNDQTEAYNAVVPFWSDNSGNITYVTGYIVQPTIPRTPIVAVPLDLTSKFESIPTQAQMVAAAQEYLDNGTPWVGDETLTVDFVNDTISTNQAPIWLGDTVHVVWSGAEIDTTLRVVETEYDCLAERFDRMTLGTQQTEFVAVTGDVVSASSGGGSGGGADVYQPGDTLTLGSYIVSDGLITSSTQVVRFMVVTPKSMKNITTVTATNLSAELRGANGYLNSQSGFYDFADRSGYTVTCAKATDNLIRVNITKSSAFTNVSNNTLVSVNLDTTVAFEFS